MAIRYTNAPRGRSGRAMILLGGAASIAGMVIFVASALTMVVLWVRLLAGSMGWLGAFLGIVTSPVAAAYPFLHWAARGEFPVLYFVVWLTGLTGITMSMAWAAYGSQQPARKSTSAEPAPGHAPVVELNASTQAIE